ncbi:similar to hedgehog protein [Cyanidioschyzon merolae strain 10D]|uniref:Similar to hedgehog protein n=1 Tax=Cyanidioschyzon merolae (strain NIES-3377 / 10D) TaxID=280699 RepID=M1V723_CYAM1|nr:similar to hedgehog protein [Cyanidioschyzon merolae strain 10D]BAM79404.1 similar to hedgehog protein [Cyanidioschyzon merolae strain 10D]|eukprot:XP_005535690.1 similar to hedgehog protein [Cyanidioschyzon merolae strain 10D]
MRKRYFSIVRLLVIVLVVSGTHTVRGVLSSEDTFLWTWIGGSNSTGSSGSYGVQGVRNTSNVPPARYGAVFWTGADGVLWLFGGGSDLRDVFGDLWNYNLSTFSWTWVGGSASLNSGGVYGSLGVPNKSNYPPSRTESAAWSDSNGNLWLYGGWNLNSGYSDMWMYNVSSGEWTWVQGSSKTNVPPTYGPLGKSSSSNTPGARFQPATWVGLDGQFYLFGGFYPSGPFYGDLWQYSTVTNEWSWIGGTQQQNPSGSYGTFRQASPSNYPAGRLGATWWRDLDGNFWLFGGDGQIDGNGGFLNDLWLYNISSKEWTWMSGNHSVGLDGAVYGEKGVPSSSNTPGYRAGSSGFADSTNTLYLFGGSSPGFCNDLWTFNITSLEWTWVDGDNTTDGAYSYGELNKTSNTTLPPPRYGAVLWDTDQNDPVLFGGQGSSGSYNDLFTLYIATPTPMPTPTPTPTASPTPSVTAEPSATTNVTQTAVGEGSAVCFPADASVLIDGLGNHLQISELRSGMAVMGVNGRGQLVEDSVLGWLHNEAGATAEILAIKTRSGKQLRLTRQHLVYRMIEHSRDFYGMTTAFSCISQKQQQQKHIRRSLELGTTAVVAVFAEDIRVGDALLDVAAHLPDPVVAIETLVTHNGLYAPLTRSGRLAVDGVLVSCYGTYASHAVAHAVLWPARVDALRKVWTSGLGTGGIVGIMPYAERLYHIWTSAARVLTKARVSVISAAC